MIRTRILKNYRSRSVWGVLALAFLGCGVSSLFGQLLVHTDAASWTGNSSPSVVSGGGPAGAGDDYLSISASSANLGTKNTSQWTGDYTSARVTGFQLDVNNFGSTDTVDLRVMLIGSGGNFTSTTSIALSPLIGWQQITFGIGSSDLTQVTGTGAA
jgi:hypothetical protein